MNKIIMKNRYVLLCGILLAIILIIFGGVIVHQKMAAATQRMLIVGDSIGIGTGVSDLKLKWYKFLPSFMEEKYDVKLDITNVSMGGNTSFAGYSRIMDLEENYFDYVVICYGQNDSLDDFSLYYESILRAVYWRYPESRIITILESSQREYTEKMKIIQELSRHYNAQVVDTIAAFNNSGMLYEELTDDGTHPNDKGQQLYYEAVRDVLTQICSDEEVSDVKEILPVNMEVEEFRNYEFYAVEEFRKASETELELELAETTAMLGISYAPIMGENQIKLYADDLLILDKEFDWEYSFIQDYIELADKQKVKFSKLRIAFGSEEQREKFQGVILMGFTE